jgi:hypothetical protein
VWTEHFSLDNGRIVGRTTVGEATARLLRFNEDERVLERTLLQQLGEYPASTWPAA